MTTPPGEGLSLLFIEGVATAVCLMAALCIPQGILPGFKTAKLINALARKRKLCVCLVGVGAFAARLAILPLSPIPKPFAAPDFSFLLAADTFASGRLTNPVHPMWPHFESLHITVTPTYMSMYFPGQGLLLAAGKIVARNAWFGLLAATALMCAALCWMLQAWLPPKWALLGGFIAILRIGLFSYWIDSYTGGSLAALGGALVLGALPRIWRRFKSVDFFWLALGMAILANSRPYEGILLCVPALAVLCWKISNWKISKKISKTDHPPLSTLLVRSAPALLLLIATVAFIGYYNYRVFGNPFTLPYTIDRRMYATAPHFLWQQARPEPVYRHREMREFYTNFELASFLKTRTLTGFPVETLLKLVAVQLFFLGIVFLVPVTMLPRALKDKRLRILGIIAVPFACGLSAETWLLPHYVAPATSMLYAFLMQCMRHMRAWRSNGRPIGIFLSRTIPAVCVLLCVLRLYAGPLNLGLSGLGHAWTGSPAYGAERDRVLSELENKPGKQLAIVRYSPDHDYFAEWVWNSADIDRSKVVWSRDMSAAENADIIRYFSDRKVWLVEPDVTPPKVSAFGKGEVIGPELTTGTTSGTNRASNETSPGGPSE